MKLSCTGRTGCPLACISLRTYSVICESWYCNSPPRPLKRWSSISGCLSVSASIKDQLQIFSDPNVIPIERDPLIFTFSLRMFRRTCDRIRDKLNMKDWKPHDLRHEATSRLFEKGLNLMEIASITGHQDLKMLKRYTHLRAEDLVARLGWVWVGYTSVCPVYMGITSSDTSLNLT